MHFNGTEAIFTFDKYGNIYKNGIPINNVDNIEPEVIFVQQTLQNISDKKEGKE